MEQSVRETARPEWKRATQYHKALPWEDSEKISEENTEQYA